MRLLFVATAVLGLVNCTADDRRYLLTYDHPKAHEAALAQPVIVQASASNSTIITSEGTRVEVQEPPPPFTPEQPKTGTAAVVPAAQALPQPAPVQPPTPPSHVVRKIASPHQASEPKGARPQLAAAPPLQRPAAPEPAVKIAGPQAVAPNDAVTAPEAARPDMREAEPAASVSAAAAIVPPSVLQSDAPSVSAAQAATQPAHVSAAAEAHCRALARQRKSDARANYYDEDTQQQIFDGTFASCMDWEGKHS